MNIPFAAQCRWLGRIGYEEALQIQETLAEAKTNDDDAPDLLLLLEHPPVYTIGRTPDQSSLRSPNLLPHPLHIVSRGGQATYHGPGQLVGYPIIDLRRREKDLHRYLREIEEILIESCAELEVPAGRRDGMTGVWTGDRKLASIGVGVRKWISMHGFALNVTRESEAGFAAITPCGLPGVSMTSLENERKKATPVLDVASIIARRFGDKL